MATTDRTRAGRMCLGGALVAVAGSTAMAAPPANDTCANAAAITAVPSTTNGTTVEATSDIPAGSCVVTIDDTIDVWYTFTNGASPQTYTFDTNGTLDTGGNAGDTSLELFDGTCGGTSVGCDDDGGLGLNSQVTYSMAANQTIKIRVAFLSNCVDPTCDFMGTVTGPFVLNVAIGTPPPPANDTCAAATVIATAPSTTMGDNGNSTGVDITPCSNTDEQDVWFSFTPATSGQYQIDTVGSTGNLDTSLAIYQGCPDEVTPNVQPNWPANLIACDDDIVFIGSGDDYLSMMRANLQAGTAYKIRVSGFNNSTGGFVLNLSAPSANLPAVPNTCATAQAVTGTFVQNYYTGGARPGGPAISCNLPAPVALGVNDNALYLTFVPGANGLLSGSISAESGVIKSDSILALFSGACGGLTEIACLDDPNNYDLSTFPAVSSGTTYYLLLGDYGTFDSGADISVNITVPGGAAPGACCAGATCSVLASGACTGPNTRYVGNGSACNAPGNNTTPCCKADYNQSGGVTVQDIFDFLAGYFTGAAQADINGGGVSVQDIFDFLAAYFAGCA